MLGANAVVVPETDGESVSKRHFDVARNSTSSSPRLILTSGAPETIEGIETSVNFYKFGSFHEALFQTSGSFVAPAGLRFETSITGEFRRCAAAWKRDTGHLSVEGEIARHEAYQNIIRMGERAIPLILEDLRQEPHHWFIALNTLSGESPDFPEESRGNIEAQADVWVEWGKSKGYID